MFIGDRLIYLALHKTGCSHVIKLLTSIPELNGKIIGKHNTIYDVPKESLGDFPGKIKAGNIRNPWDWYVSLWAFGSMEKGGLYDHTVKRSFIKKLIYPHTFFTPAEKWKKVYSDAKNPELFRTWLKMILLERKKDIIGYGTSHLSDTIGFLSYRYLNLYTYNFKKKSKMLRTYADVFDFDTKNNFIDNFIYLENINNDVRKLLEKAGLSETTIAPLLETPKTNKSFRDDYKNYYDAQTIKLVNEKEKLIIQKHNYTF